MGDIVERLKSQNELYVQKYVGTYDIDENKIEPLCEEAAAEITRLREENARLLKENSELLFRAHALLWLLPPETTCGELRKARDEMLAATMREGDKG